MFSQWDVSSKASGGGTYNLGVGAGYSAGQVLGMISDVSGIALPALVSSRRPGDSAELVSDASRGSS